jgi:hypothetical protein
MICESDGMGCGLDKAQWLKELAIPLLFMPIGGD